MTEVQVDKGSPGLALHIEGKQRLSNAKIHQRFTEEFTNLSVTQNQVDGNHVMLAACMVLTPNQVKSMALDKMHFECMFIGN